MEGREKNDKISFLVSNVNQAGVKRRNSHVVNLTDAYEHFLLINLRFVICEVPHFTGISSEIACKPIVFSFS